MEERVISTAIDKYISVHITKQTNSQITINTPDHRETVSDPDQIQHPLIREAIRKTFPPASGGVGGGDSEGVAEWLGGVRGVEYPSQLPQMSPHTVVGWDRQVH